MTTISAKEQAEGDTREQIATQMVRDMGRALADVLAERDTARRALCLIADGPRAGLYHYSEMQDVALRALAAPITEPDDMSTDTLTTESAQ